MRNHSNSISNRAIVIFSTISVAIGLLGFALLGSAKFVKSMVSAPLELSEYALTNTTPQSLPHFSVVARGDKMLDRGYNEETTTTIGTSSTIISAYFGFLAFGEHLIVVKTKDAISENVTEYTGVLTAISDDKVALEFYNAYLHDEPELNGRLVPMLLDTNYEVMGWYLGLGIVAGFVIMGLVGLIVVALMPNRNAIS